MKKKFFALSSILITVNITNEKSLMTLNIPITLNHVAIIVQIIKRLYFCFYPPVP